MKACPSIDMDIATNANTPCLLGARREEADDYPGVIAELNSNWRVIECRDAIQWILQRQTGTRHGQPRWDARCYNRTRQGLLRRVRALTSECDANALAVLQSLPERMEARR